MYSQTHRLLFRQLCLKTHQGPVKFCKILSATNFPRVFSSAPHPSTKEKYHNSTNNTVSKTSSTHTIRTHTCNELRASDVDKDVVVCGWLQYQRINTFIVLRDGYGQVQIVLPQDRNDLKAILNDAPLESVLQINGMVARRPKDQIKKNIPTGEIEVIASDVTILNKADVNIPFLIRNYHKAKEELRLKHRYLDLRFPEMQHNLRFRSQFLMRAREFLINQRDFVEVETPTLFKRTPGGAREFVVPTHEKNAFYSLVQSPQQLKQLLMVGSVDRYFQVARCYRDESTRPDRQPEFTQLDIELSFTTRDSVLSLIEQLLCHCLNIDPRQFPRMTYQDAMSLYGTDKPDLRYECKITNLARFLSNRTDTSADTDSAYCSLALSKAADRFSNKTLAEYQDLAKKSYPGAKVTAVKIQEDGTWRSKLSKMLPQLNWEGFTIEGNVKPDDVLLVAWGRRAHVLSLLGDIRVQFHRDVTPPLNAPLDFNDPRSFNVAWIVDFPLFLPVEDGTGVGVESANHPVVGLESAHHPFTLPHPEDEHLLLTKPLEVRGLHYDLVLNGCEVGGGSIRIHQSELQERILRLLNIDPSTLQHMIQAFKCGCPPHGGIALGIDRLMSILCQTPTIRDVIAFPKAFGGKDHLSGAPCDIAKEEKDYYHLR